MNQSDYEFSKKDAFSLDLNLRLKRAKSKHTHPEILYFLASDENNKVRKAVASNKNTPYHTLKLLAEDHDEKVRATAVKLLKCNLVQLQKKDDSKKQFIMQEVITMLSRDQSAQIRYTLSETIKETEFVPHDVAMRLANDVAQNVAQPMLKVFKQYTDADLITVLENQDELWRYETVAEREEISSKLANFLIDSGHVSVVKKLLAHKKLELAEPELIKIVRLTELHDEMALHVVNYRSLPGRLAKKLVKFVSQSLLKTLMRRTDFDTETINDIQKIAQRRLQWLDQEKEYTDPKAMVIALYHSDGLNEEILTDALSWKKNEFVLIALTLIADSKLDLITSIFQIKSQKAIMALVWRIGFSAKFGVLLQKKLAEIHQRDLLYAKHGVGHPLSEDEMLWQLDFFDLNKESEDA